MKSIEHMLHTVNLVENMNAIMLSEMCALTKLSTNRILMNSPNTRRQPQDSATLAAGKTYFFQETVLAKPLQFHLELLPSLSLKVLFTQQPKYLAKHKVKMDKMIKGIKDSNYETSHLAEAEQIQQLLQPQFETTGGCPTPETPLSERGFDQVGKERTKGNVLALVVLAAHRRESRNKVSLFHILVSGLIVTDLLGTLLISPVVLSAYGAGRSLRELGLCDYCAFAMSFFGLTSMFILFAMALERCLSIGCPYLYRRHASKRGGLLAVPAIYVLAGLFCSLPLLGVGENSQYCPGTWCFIQMQVHSLQLRHRVYSLSYAVLMKLLIVAVLLCNVSVIVDLCRMFQKQRTRRCSRAAHARSERSPQSEEVDHLILLAIVTITFVACSVPLTVRAYIGAIYKYEVHSRNDDLQALRCLSFNSIIDPWVFIILNTSKVKKMVSKILCCKITSRRPELQTTSFIRIETVRQESLWNSQS
ncbi:LOW QUALITY PROTEIN: prostaglandin E2 receptor EP2 subtype-like [Mustelus asterias]